MKLAVLAEELRKARRKSGLTQKELGEMIGVTRQMITRIESGTQNVTIKTLQKLTGALEYDFTIELKQKKRSKRLA
ncbi:helix-turn-helix domain-containing protein [Adhaeribacter rhizoryzae]|uniref:Helix-turn-helix transcriptional regulator n=1 Tax=Adhaeribacter rhizoryzae TaxID=2607907 RepID=A0A5M6CWS7_9BACT|nr:helix-turn-helix transcriptional regulator [Adhaeribacter rhizoryzae]KAA5539678.1 helix-turn-helix transcriptional regulator [Adhaeribacter rhizoryzae]